MGWGTSLDLESMMLEDIQKDHNEVINLGSNL